MIMLAARESIVSEQVDVNQPRISLYPNGH